MNAIKLSPKPLAQASHALSTTNPAKGGMFYRWHMRRERLRELNHLLALEPHFLADIGVTRNQVEAEIAALRHAPV
jgi:uncharacterized protein YjiS (DUF1127 family)